MDFKSQVMFPTRKAYILFAAKLSLLVVRSMRLSKPLLEYEHLPMSLRLIERKVNLFACIDKRNMSISRTQ